MHPLTDAYIKGAAKFKKAKGTYFYPTDSWKPKGACSVGKIIWGLYGDKAINDPIDSLYQIKIDNPSLSNQLVAIPCEHAERWENKGQVLSILIHLNDEHDGRSGWGDKEISDWLEKTLISLGG